MATIPEFWTGNQPVASEPSAYRVLRTLSISSAGWTQYDVTSNDFAGAADGLAQQSNDVTNAMIRSIAILNNSSVAGENVNISLYVSGGNPDPVTAFNTAYVNGPSVEIRLSVDMNQNLFWLKADAGNPTAQLEIWYDIPA